MPSRTSPPHRSQARPRHRLCPVLPALALVLVSLWAPGAAIADGTPLAPTVLEAQYRPTVSPDGRGGAIVGYKTSPTSAGAVHVANSGLADGRMTIAPATVPFEFEAEQPLRARAIGDSTVLLVADLASAGGAFATQLGDLGVPSAGQPSTLTMPLRRPAIVPTNDGRTLAIAMDADATSFWTLRVAVLGPLGTLQSAIEIPSNRQFFYGDAISACSDGAGGLLAAMPYYDAAVTGSKDIGIFRYAADGTRPWGDTVQPLVIAARDQVDVQVIADGAGGMLLTWTDPRFATHSSDIYAHRVTGSGARDPRWGFYGNIICDANGTQSQPRMVSDGNGGAWIVWLDQGASVDGDLRYSHVFGDGTLASGFTTAGRALCDASGAQSEAALAGDGAGGLFVVWRDDRSGTADIYAQHIGANGLTAAGWETSGRAICVAAGVQDQPAIGAIGAGRVVLAWRDARTTTPRIYTTALFDASTTGVTPGASNGLLLAPLTSTRGIASVRVTLPASDSGTLELLDAAGRRLATLPVQGPLLSATRRFERALAPGQYFARLRVADHEARTRLTVLR